MSNPLSQFTKKESEDLKIVMPEAPKTPVVTTVAKDEPKEEMRSTVLLSELDAHIHERMKSQPRSLEGIDVKVEEKRADGKHRLSLPDELTSFLNKYAFRWIFKSRRAIDEACDIRGWTLINRTYFPDIPNYLFTVNGSIERGDNILAFMPKERAEMLRRAPGIRSTEIVTSTLDKHKNDPNFYKPTDSEDERVIMI